MQSNSNTLESLLRAAISSLSNSSVSPGLDARVLLKHVTGLTSEQIIKSPETPVDQEYVNLYIELIERRTRGEPIAYLTGIKEFWGLNFSVSPDVLIPRPETELLVENALLYVDANDGPLSILDLGTGSGCVLIALAHELRRRGISFVAIGVDKSFSALKVARHNASIHNLENQIYFCASNWMTALDERELQFDLILGNPPYIAEKDESISAGVHFEPASALWAGKDGLDCIKEILLQAPKYLTTRGQLMFEFGYGQRLALDKLIDDSEMAERERIYHADLSGIDRVVELRP